MPLEQPSQRVPARARSALALAALLALGGCISDDSGSSRTSSQPTPTRSETTTDTGSRFMDAAGPVGGLTVETPPVGPRPTRGRIAGRR